MGWDCRCHSDWQLCMECCWMTADNSKTECWFVHHRSRNISMQLLGNAIYVGARWVATGKCRGPQQLWSSQQQIVFWCLHRIIMGKVTYIYIYLKGMLIDSEATMSVPWVYRKCTFSIPWLYCQWIVSVPWVYRERTVSIPWVYRERTVSAS